LAKDIAELEPSGGVPARKTEADVGWKVKPGQTLLLS